MKKITLIAAGFLVASASFAQGNGKLNLQKGQKLLIDSKVNSTITQEMMGQSMEITAAVNSTASLDVNEVSDNKYNLTNTITHLDMNMSMMGNEMKFDSDKKGDMNGEMGAEMGKIVNKPMPVFIDKNGKAIKLKDKKEDAGAMMGGMAGDPSAAYESAFILVPADAKAGTSWTDSSSDDMSKKTTTYTVREIKNNDAVLDVKGTIITSGVNEMKGMQVKVNTTGNVTGETIVDMTSGIVKSQALTVESTGTSEVMGQEIPLTSKVITKTTITAGK